MLSWPVEQTKSIFQILNYKLTTFVDVIFFKLMNLQMCLTSLRNYFLQMSLFVKHKCTPRSAPEEN